MSDLRLWLQALDLEKYAEIFARNDVDLSVVPDLTDQDLEKLGVTLGHRRKLIAAAARLRSDPAAPIAGPSENRSPRRSQQAVERRQVTVLFVDLVGSTALSKKLDPEDMGHLLRVYRDACAAVIAKYDGHVAQYLGDGILAYFGYPRAQEDAAERAVRAALDTVNEIGRLKHSDGQPLEVRAGIATGLVATSEMADQDAAGEQTVVGETPNLAARLQALAEPTTVLVSPSTHRLTYRFFEYLFAGEHSLKGYHEPLAVWRVLGESAVESRFVAARGTGRDTIIGRERELVFLSDSWERATRGEGHVVLVTGEAGMGKSRLIEAFAERISERPVRLLRCQCSPYHSNSPLHPVRQLVRHRLDIRENLPAAENLTRIDRMLAHIGRPSQVSRLLMAELLEIPSGETLSPMEMTAVQRKNETLALLQDFLLAGLDGATVLLLVEDAHWSDPTTRSLIDRLLKRIEKERALVLITFRPELKTAWADHPNVSAIWCKQLGRDLCAALIRQVVGQMQVDGSVIGQIVARSDGVPLFVEELTKAVVDVGSAQGKAVPLTLQDSLAARLDRLGKSKAVAQAAAVIGREFSHSLLALIAEQSGPELESALGNLATAGLILRTGEESPANYRFNHSLVQEAAYEGLARNRRQALHARIADQLSAGAEATPEADPGLIAYHFSRAGEVERAFRYWLRAAQLAGRRSAFAEAQANLNAALEEADRISDPSLRARLTLEAQLKLGAVHIIQGGPASDPARLALERAHALAKQADPGPELFQAAWGLYLNAASKYDFDEARMRGDELIAVSRTLNDEDLQFEALHHHWGMAYFTGQTLEMLRRSKLGMDRYDSGRHHRFSEVYGGHDPGVCAHACQSLGLALLGRSTAVRQLAGATIRLADGLEHPVTLAFSLGLVSHAAHLAGDFGTCSEYAERMLRVAEKYEFAQQRAFALFMLGSARVLGGDLETGLQQMLSSFDVASTYRFPVIYPSLAMAEALLRAQRYADASKIVTRTFDSLRTPESGLFVSELWRLRAELALSTSPGAAETAERDLRAALRIASEQGANVFRLRAGLALAKLLADEGRREDARSALAHACPEPLPDFIGPEIRRAADLQARLN